LVLQDLSYLTKRPFYPAWWV